MGGAWATPEHWLAHTAVGGGALLLLVWLLMRLTRQPARRQRLGEWGVAAALLVSGLCLAPAWLHLPLPRWLEPSPMAALPQPPEKPSAIESATAPSNDFSENTSPGWDSPAWASPAVVLAPRPEPGIDGDSVEPSDAGLTAGDSTRAEPTGAASATVAEAPTSVAPISWTRVTGCFSGIYVAAGAFLLGRWLIGHIGVWRLLRNAARAPAPVEQLFGRVAAEKWAGRHTPRLRVSSRLRVPVSCGLIRPTVLLPASLCEPEARPALPWVFAHELTHLERRDAWTCLLFGVAQAFYFYLPWFWWLRRQVRLCQEYVADAAAVDVSRAEDYAQFLLSWTTAPAAPVAAIGVLGNTSDLFRRVTMLLQNPMRVESRCPRRWSLAMAGGLLALAVLVSGIGWRTGTANAGDQFALAEAANADDEQPAKNDDPAKKDKPAKKAEPAPEDDEDVDKVLEKLPPDVRAQVKKTLERLDKEFPTDRFPGADDMKKEMRQMILRVVQQGGGIGGFGGPGGFGQGFGQVGLFGQDDAPNHGRLGVVVDRPSDALVEQLDLPKGQGLVIKKVEPNSAAAKAGMKASDILLEFAGKPVPNDTRKFVKTLDEVKANTPVDAVVLRKGKKETIQGISLPEAKAVKQQPGGFGGFQPGGFGGFQGGAPGIDGFLPGQGGIAIGGLQLGGGQGQVMTTMIRTDDRFTTRYQEGSLIITLTGTVADGKAKLGSIQVHDGNDTHKYESVDKVPEQYRDKVKHLVEMSEKGTVRIEIKSSPGDKGNKEQKNKTSPGDKGNKEQKK